MTRRDVRNEQRTHPGVRLPLWGVGFLALLIILFLVVSSIWLFNTVQNLATEWEVTGPNFDPVALQPDGRNEEAGETANQSIPNLPAEEPIISTDAFRPWSGRDRVNILLLGIDQRCDEEGPTRTDTMMVMTIDPVGLSAAMLSLPRDLWVEIPGFGVDKINQAHFLGEIYEYPGGGPGLAVDTVEAILGVHVDYFAAVNFDAFIQGVDQIGGVDVVVQEDIADDTYPDSCYGYDPFYLTAGEQHLDGQTALKYARTRATFGGDVDRAARQQEVITAVWDKVVRLGMVPQLIGQAPDLWRIFQKNVRTNMSLNEAIQLVLLLQDIPAASRQTEVLDYDYVYNETTPDGQQVLVPVRDQIRLLRDQLFSPPAVPTPVVENLTEKVADESARVAVYNGTQVFGLAGATQEYLQQLGINVTEIGNADSAEYRATQIIDYGSHPHTALYLVQLMGIPPLNITTSSSPPAGNFDVLIVLGSDWSVPGFEGETVGE
jgi:polyisoprenyl-teichoic acid--peptidoglycan teichoic acid transferase